MNNGVRLNFRIGADGAVAKDAVRAHLHAVAQHHTAFQHHVHVQLHIAAMFHRAAHIQARRVDDGNAADHEFVRPLPAIVAFQLGQLHLVVHTQHFRFGGRHDGTYLAAIFHA